MPLIMVCYLFAFFDRINISFAKFQLQGALNLSDTAYGLGAICMLVVGRVSDASGERRAYVAALLVAAALGFFAAGRFDRQTARLVVALAVMGGGVVASIPAFWALPPRLLTGAGAAGGIALINTLGQLGGIVSPVLVGRIKDATGSTTPALYAIGLASLVCAAVMMKALPAAAMKAVRG